MIAFFRRYVLHNFGLKALSLLMATGLWFLIARDEQPAEVTLRAPIVFQNVPKDLEIGSESVPEAQIRVRGPERIVRQVQANEVHAEIDLSNVKIGDLTFDLTSQQVRHPRDVSVVQVVPSQFHLVIDKRVRQQVQIHPHIVGDFADGEMTYRTDPPSIMITGPRAHVEKVDAATTDPIDASGVRGTAVFTTNAFVSDPLVQVLQAPSIQVTVTVQKAGSGTAH